MSRHDYEVTVVTFKWEQYHGPSPPTNLADFVEWARHRLNEIPEEHRNAARIEIDSTISYDQSLATVEISYRRRPTQEEISQRVAEEEARAQKDLAWARAKVAAEEKRLADLRKPEST